MMRRKLFPLLLLLLLAACSAAGADAVKDFSFTPLDHAVEVTFSAEGYDTVKVVYGSAQEKGELVLEAGSGRFTGILSLPETWPGNNVSVTVRSAKGRELMKKTLVQTAVADIPAVEKAPSGRLSGVTVCIDPGHQGVPIKLSEPLGPGLSGRRISNNGQAQGTVTRRKESVVVLEIGLKLRNALLLEGADVVMTREDQQTAVSCVRRAEIAAEGGADLLIRLHCDSSSDKNRRGIHVYLPLSSDYAKQVADPATYRTYGDALYGAICEATGIHRGSVVQNNSYCTSNWATMPAFLVEMGYMSNAQDDAMLSTEEYQEAIIRGMVDGLEAVARLRGIIE